MTAAEITADPEIREQFGRLTVLERAGFASGGKALVLCSCTCGARVVRRLGNLRSGRTTSCGCYRKENTAALNVMRTPAPRSARVPPAYTTALAHVRKARGPAPEHSCAECGRTAYAWSYCRCADDELIDAAGLPYSLDPDYYIPLCRSCATRAAWERNQADVNRTAPAPARHYE